MLGLVVSFHAGIVLLLLAPPLRVGSPLQRLRAGHASAEDALVVTLSASTAVAPEPSQRVGRPAAAHEKRTLATRTRARTATMTRITQTPRPTPSVPATQRAPGTYSQLPAPSVGTWRNPELQALTESESRPEQRLPGDQDGSVVKGISVREPLSVRQQLQRTGKYMHCSKVRMARNLPGSVKNARGISPNELNLAFLESGCT